MGAQRQVGTSGTSSIRCASVEQAASSGLPPRAGGSDVQALVRVGRAAGPWADLRRIPDLDRVEADRDGGLRIGAMVTVGKLAADPMVRGDHPAVAAAAADLATPQIRAVATLGGNLLQATRCPYYRYMEVGCERAGGVGCPAREGGWHEGVAIDRGGCAAPHPSTLALALLVHGGRVACSDGRRIGAEELYGDGSAVGEHRLPAGVVVTHVLLPPPWRGERGGYARAAARRRAEWPIAEVAVRVEVDEGRILRAAVGVGGVAAVPLRLPAVESRLRGRSAQPPPDPSGEDLGLEATPGAGAAWKLRVVAPLLGRALERALAPAGR